MTYFLWRHFSARSSFYCFNEQSIQRGVYEQKFKFFYGSVFVIWLYLQKAMYRPCDLDLWHMKVNYFQWIEYNPISILYEFQIAISSNSREIKYQNIGRTHTQTDTHTDRQTDRVKTIPRNPLRGRGNYARFSCTRLYD